MEEWYQSNKVSFQRNRGCMVNYRNVSYALGVLVLVEAGFFALCAGVSFYYQEEDYIHFLETLLINVVLGGLLLLGGKRNEVSINRRDGYCIVSLSWILFSALGMLPFLFSGYIPSISDAFFETMSGFTTTGATILDHIETLPHGLLFWRSLTQWIGGLGIVLFTIALLPLFSGSSQQLFLSEATGRAVGCCPKIEATVQ